MPPEIVDLNDYQVADWPTTPEGEARQADEVETHYRTLLGHPAVAGDHVVGLPGRRLAQRPDRARPRRRLAEARVRAAARPGQGRVVAAADDDADRRRRPDPGDRVPRRLRGRVRGAGRRRSRSTRRGPWRRRRPAGLTLPAWTAPRRGAARRPGDAR